MDKTLSKSFHGLPVRTVNLFVDIFALFGCAIIAGLLVYYARQAIPDDAFIYLRIAENIVSGNGWSYNAGIPSDAATSPVFIFVLSAIRVAGITGRDTLLVGYAIGLFAISATIYWQLRNQGRIAAMMLALTASGLPMLLQNVGLESSVFLACVVLTSMAYARGWKTATGLLAGLTALARPEGIAMLILVIGADIVKRKRVVWKTILAGLCVIVPWLVFSLLEFGSIVPHTTKIKSLQSHMVLWDAVWPITFIKQIPLPLFVLPAAIAGIFVSGKEFLQDRPFLILIIGFGIAQVVGYSILHAPVGYFWYYAPGNLAVYLSASVALIEILRRLWPWQKTLPERLIANKLNGYKFLSDARHAGLLARISAFGLAAILCYFTAQEVCYLHSKFVRLKQPYRLSLEYIAIGQWLKEHADRSDFVAADEIGYVGYYSNLPLRDMLGLLEFESTIPLTQHRWDWWYTDYPTPEYIVVHKAGGPGEPNSKRFPWPLDAYTSFISNYNLVYIAGTVAVFQKSPVPSAAAGNRVD